MSFSLQYLLLQVFLSRLVILYIHNVIRLIVHWKQFFPTFKKISNIGCLLVFIIIVAVNAIVRIFGQMLIVYENDANIKSLFRLF